MQMLLEQEGMSKFFRHPKGFMMVKLLDWCQHAGADQTVYHQITKFYIANILIFMYIYIFLRETERQREKERKRACMCRPLQNDWNERVLPMFEISFFGILLILT